MTQQEVVAYVMRHGKMPNLEEVFNAPVTWIPNYPSNPSKLQAHKFVNGEWIPLPYSRFVSWPEKFG